MSQSFSISRLGVFLFVLYSISGSPTLAQTKGGYTRQRPSICKPLPNVIYKTNQVSGATPTNQWWSSLVWEKHSQNMFPHPLGVLFCDSGLSISYPGAAIVSPPEAIMGGGVSSNGDLVIGHDAIPIMEETRLESHSPWFITAVQKQNGSTLRMTLGHGSPFIYCRILGGNARIRFADHPKVFTKLSDSSLGITVRGNHYGLFGAKGSNWSGEGTAEFTHGSTEDYFSVALLPDDSEETLRLFAKHAHHHVVSTEANFQFDAGQLVTDYKFKMQTLEGAELDSTLFATYPHQWKYITTPLTDLSYDSVRGKMKIGKGSFFRTSIPLQGALPTLPGDSITDQQQMVTYLQQEADKSVPQIADTYWEGKYLGKLTTLAGIAEVLGKNQLEKKFVDEIRERLENWFTAASGESTGLFFYDSQWGTLIGSPASYGSDSEINDHHFHYGYFIRAAAAVARRDRTWGKNWGNMVDLLVRDIASTIPNDELFPRLRCFDVYAGHSWASGHARFGDGNNQESSSEAINAWYAMMLWGEVSGNRAIRDTGFYLYNTERTAVEEYWFDVSDTNFPPSFPNVALGMIWGGKGAFATWFSSDIDCIHGINWLPFTPASIYMGRHPDYVKKNFDEITRRRKNGTDYNNGWGDLVVMFAALYDPSIGRKHLQSVPDCKIEEGNTRAFMHHWLQTLSRYGRNHSDITSNHPFVNVYLKDGSSTYMAYNFNHEPLTVTFSDGTRLKAKPGKLTIHESKDAAE